MAQLMLLPMAPIENTGYAAASALNTKTLAREAIKGVQVPLSDRWWVIN